jgi:hypothetical protein
VICSCKSVQAKAPMFFEYNCALHTWVQELIQRHLLIPLSTVFPRLLTIACIFYYESTLLNIPLTFVEHCVSLCGGCIPFA